MGRKSNPISFRLLKNDVTSSQWYAHKNYTETLHDDFVIREIINYLYQKNYKSWVNNIIIKRNSQVLYVYIYIFASREKYIEIDYSFRIKKMIKKYLNIIDQKIEIITYNYYNIFNLEKNEVYNQIEKSFSHLRWLQLQHEFFRLAFISIYTKNVTAFCNFLATRIARAKRHRKLIYITRNLLARFIRFENELIGVRIRFKGRIDGRPRAKKMYLQKGSVPLHTVSAAISYHLSHVFSRYGTFGVRIWLCFTKSNTEYFYEYKLKQEQLKQEEEERKEKEEIINSGLGKNEIDFMLKRVVKKKKKLDYIIEDYHKNLVPRPSYIIPKDKRFENFNEKINKSTGGGLYNKKSFILWYFLYKYNVKNKSILNEKFFIKLMLLLYKTPGEKKTYYSNLINKIFKTQLLLNIYHINKNNNKTIKENISKKIFDEYDLDQFHYKKELSKKVEDIFNQKPKEKHYTNIKKRKISNQPKNYKKIFKTISFERKNFYKNYKEKIQGQNKPFNNNFKNQNKPFNNNFKNQNKPFNNNFKNQNKPFNNNFKNQNKPFNNNFKNQNKPFNNNFKNQNKPFNNNFKNQNKPFNNNFKNQNKPFNNNFKNQNKPFNNNFKNQNKPFNNNFKNQKK